MPSKTKGSQTRSRFENPRKLIWDRTDLVDDFMDGVDDAVSGAQLQAFLKNGKSAMFVKDTSGRYLQVNEHFVREFGVPCDAILGRTDGEIFPADLARSLQLNDAPVLAQGKTAEFKQQRLCGARWRTNLICKFPVQDDLGRVIGIGGTITDITEQVR